MKKYPVYQVDAFASELFKGNPAAVCVLPQWLSDATMQSIALENNLSETAFIVQEGKDFHIRWFTPNTEVALCGHATLASAFVIFEKLNYKNNTLVFHSQSGELPVRKIDNTFQLDFPALPFQEISPRTELLEAINIEPEAVYESAFDLLLIYNNEHEVEQASVDLYAISMLPKRGIILSAPANKTDIYSRCFYPGCGVPEDPVTGSAHCVIAPFWCKQLGINKIHARQGLKRQGELMCEVLGGRVLLTGACHLYLEGHIYI